MGILVSQLPPMEFARLKAELAEILIADFCYPRFFDYRTDSLRMRPVDRAKRQEVWQYLGSVDFDAWGNIDLVSPDLQRQVERFLIHFVQRNRSFFGEQGRKRMADIRMLISSASSSVVEGLRGHVAGRSNAFGSPRPVTSWVTSNITGHPELGWEQILASTMLLQQQLQEVRGEIKAPTSNDARLNGTSARRSTRVRSTFNGSSIGGPEVTLDQRLAMSKPEAQGAVRTNSTLEHPSPANPIASSLAPEVASASTPAPAAPYVRKVERIVVSENTPVPTAAGGKSAETAAAPHVHSPAQIQRPAIRPATAQPRDLPQITRNPQMGVTTKESEGTTVLVNDEDVVIFEQMRHQLVVWLRIEAVRAGIDISGHEPSELLELLRQQDGDETQLQIVSTLLNLSIQIIATGHAGLLEYKQAMMFYLMHTRRSR